MPFCFQGKVAVVTGGSSGIGKQTAFLLAQNGAEVYMLSRSNKLTQDDNERIRSSALKLAYKQLDVSDEIQADQVVESIVKEKGRIDILVHSAGIAQEKKFTEMTSEDWRRIIDINLTGSFLMIKAVSGCMIKQQYGKIIIISSGSVITGTGGGAHYTASKAGQIGMVRSLAKEFGKYNININAVGPRSIDTPMLSGRYSDERKNEVIGETPLGRLGTPEDVANLVLFLASDEGSFITGQFILIDGGRT